VNHLNLAVSSIYASLRLEAEALLALRTDPLDDSYHSWQHRSASVAALRRLNGFLRNDQAGSSLSYHRWSVEARAADASQRGLG
jgi:hypothetical protein